MLQAPDSGEQTGQISLVTRQADQDVLKPYPRFDAGGLTGREEGVDDGGTPSVDDKIPVSEYLLSVRVVSTN